MTPEDVQAHADNSVTRLIVPSASADAREQMPAFADRYKLG
jgi:hypothetical protein